MKKVVAEPQRIYEDFDPLCKWHSREVVEVYVEVHVQGFKKEELRVQTNNMGIAIIRGERPLNETIWSRFHKEIKLPEKCDTNEVRAKLAGGILTVTMPQKASEIPKTTFEPHPSAAQDKEKPKPSITQTNNKEIDAKLQPDLKYKDYALLDHQNAGQRNLVSTIKQGKDVALKIAVVVAVVVVFGFGAYLKYKHGQPYCLEK